MRLRRVSMAATFPKENLRNLRIEMTVRQMERPYDRGQFTANVLRIDLCSLLYGGVQVFDSHVHVCETVNGLNRGELSYLAPLGSENISAPYFKQSFFRGGGIPPPPRLSQTPSLPVPRQK